MKRRSAVYQPGANPTTVSYNASVVKTTSRLVRYKTKNSFFYFEKNDLACYNAGVVVVDSKVVGLAPAGHLQQLTMHLNE
jgi:glutamate formiminotransferase